MGIYDHYLTTLNKNGYLSDSLYNQAINNGSVGSGFSSISSVLSSGLNTGNSNVSAPFSDLIAAYMKMESESTDKANALQRELMNSQIAATRQENALDRQFSAQSILNQQNFNRNERLETQKYNSAEAQLTRDWMTDLDNSKYQRTVADLKAAGLNPMLALGHGAGSVPSGPSASSSAAQSSAASAPGRSFSSASAFKSQYSNVLNTVLNFMLKTQELDQQNRHFNIKQSQDAATALLNALIPG